MTLATTFAELQEQLETLRELLSDLDITLVEDKPLNDMSAPEGQFYDAALGARGYLEEALAAAREGREAADARYDLQSVQRWLVACHEQFDLFLDGFSSGLFSADRIRTLDRSRRGRGREWRAWMGVVIDTLGRCQTQVNHVTKSLILCSQEIADRSGTVSMSVQATNIGQQITTPEGGEGLQ